MLVRPSGQIARPAHDGSAADLSTAPEWLGLWVKHHRGWVYSPGSKVATGAHRLWCGHDEAAGSSGSAAMGSDSSCGSVAERGG
jgi:hypothetical protein